MYITESNAKHYLNDNASWAVNVVWIQFIIRKRTTVVTIPNIDVSENTNFENFVG